MTRSLITGRRGDQPDGQFREQTPPAETRSRAEYAAQMRAHGMDGQSVRRPDDSAVTAAGAPAPLPSDIARDRSRQPAGQTADQRGKKEHGAAWSDGPDRPADLASTRPYGQAGGLTVPDPRHQREIEAAVPRGEDGAPGRFPEPRQPWFEAVNDGGPRADPLRGNNCVDCSLALISTWQGLPQVAAPRFPDRLPDGSLDIVAGEKDGPARAEQWLGHQYEYLGSAEQGCQAIEQKLHEGGHGASAAIINSWKDGKAHAWNAVNYQGDILWMDAQRCVIGTEPVQNKAQMDRMWAIVIDEKGRQL